MLIKMTRFLENCFKQADICKENILDYIGSSIVDPALAQILIEGKEDLIFTFCIPIYI